ncbi:hypothetical protein BXZ70DRAFT_293416 [Cristinia sonorae]|uniref:Homeobox domain-containing protein n=1 Tax=Cristinia sonorae TaxID=1940300 RepID=A0A8K0UL55_9AGAR|nr:hypothetical protein BXZ70DRAFT_293416 [Cristinia sonorae]
MSTSISPSRIQSSDSLRRIADSARSLLTSIGPAPSVFEPSTPLVDIKDTIAFIPPAQPITSLLISRGLPHDTSRRISDAYVHKAGVFKRECETQFAQVLRHWKSGLHTSLDSERILSAMQSAYIQRYQANLKEWQQLLIAKTFSHTAAQDVQEMNELPLLEKKSTFRPESVPFLEKAYANNAYPNRSEKESLAWETGMEYKQINIWFQNRRARSKKDGQTPKRTATFAVASSSYSRSPSAARTTTPLPDSNNTINNISPLSPSARPGVNESSMDCLSCFQRPPHAYPAPYPPVCASDPFPVRNGCGSFDSPWPRKCATRAVRSSLLDMDTLITGMVNLALADETCNSSVPLATFTIVPARAPLPALIRITPKGTFARPVASQATATALLPNAGLTLSSSNKGPYKGLSMRVPDTPPSTSSRVSQSPPTRPLPIIRSKSKTRHNDRQRRRPITRSPSPPPSSRSTSVSSLLSDHSESSYGPATPPSESHQSEPISFKSDISLGLFSSTSPDYPWSFSLGGS